MKYAMIIARGGSKRIPRKNIRHFCGKPIIAYSIQAALDSGCFDEVMVSTDDSEIADVAKSLGATVPFLRSKETASDHATTAEVLVEVLQSYEMLGVRPQAICCIYPTAPFVTPMRIKSGMQMLLQNPTVDSVFPVVRFSYPIQRALWLQDDGKLDMIHRENLLVRSQDLRAAFHDVGQFYWLRVAAFKLEPSLIPEGRTAGIVLPEWEVQDIDNEDDWVLAEMKYKMLAKQQEVCCA